MRKFILMFSALMLCVSVAFGQGKTISGKIVDDASGETVIGATIQVKGAEASGTITDFDGNFTITLPDGHKMLIVSYVGYETVEVEAKNGMVVRLATSSEVLDEVMVVAYGTSTKKSFTGSATVVKGETLEKKNPSEVTKALAGEIAGVQVVSSTGQPGTSASVRIRGIGSVNSSTAPLYVVDGIPYEGDISSIDPSDIASTTVLKDATATSIYGSRGANGVILITTKKGTSGESGKIDIDVKYGGNMRLLPMYSTITDPGEFVKLAWLGIYNQSGSEKVASNTLFSPGGAKGGLPSAYNIWNAKDNAVVLQDGQLAPGLELKPGYINDPDPGWKKAIFRNGQKIDATVKIHGGSEKTTYFTSFGYLKDEGYYIGSDFSRFSGRASIDHQAKKWLRGSMNMSYAYATTNSPGQSSNMNNGFAYVNEAPPIYPVFQRDAEGNRVLDPRIPGKYAYDYGDLDINGNKLGRLYGQGINPAGALQYDKMNNQQHNFAGNAMLEATFVKGLKLSTTFGMQFVGQTASELTNSYYGDAAGVGRIAKVYQNFFTFTWNQLLTYTTDFDGNHNLDVLLGHETGYTRSASMQGNKNITIRPDGMELGNAVEMAFVSSDNGQYTLESYFGQLKYSYKDRYFFYGSLRGDGSSRFAKGHRWGLFGSVGVAWMLTNEDFMQGVNLLRNFKIKASWGVLGNQNISNFLYTNWYSISNVGNEPGFNLEYIGNPELTWESSNSADVGIEFSLGKYFDAEIDYFYKYTTDMLFPRYVAPSLGYGYYYVNDGAIVNQGIEFQFNIHAVNTNAVKFDIRLNGAHYSNKVTKMPLDNSGKSQIMNGQWSLGHSMLDYYMVNYEGVNNQGLATYRMFFDPYAPTLYKLDSNNQPLLDENGMAIVESRLNDEQDFNTASTGEFYDLGLNESRYSISSVHTYMASRYVTEDMFRDLTPEEKKNVLAIVTEEEYQDRLAHPEKYLAMSKTSNYQNASSYYIGKSAIPALQGGIGFDLSVYGVELSASFQYSLGGWGYDGAYAMLMHNDRAGSRNWHTDMIGNTWQKEGDELKPGILPKLTNGGQYSSFANATSTRFLTSLNYLTLSNVRIGYSFPKKMIEKIKLNTLSLWVSGDNLFSVTARKGYLPMASFSGGSSTYAYTPLSTIMGGIKISF